MCKPRCIYTCSERIVFTYDDNTITRSLLYISKCWSMKRAVYNMFAIVDIQGFYVNYNFCPKELVIWRENKIAYFLFKPSVQFFDLSIIEQKTVEFTEIFHGLSYNEGYVDSFEFNEIIKKFLVGCEFVYVKGDQKTLALRDALSTYSLELPQIINVKQLNNPPTFHPGLPQCLNHKNRIGRCALTNVKTMYEWIKKYLPK